MKHIYEIKTRQEDDKNKILENPIFDFIIDKFLLIFLILIIFLWKSYGRAQIENIEKNLLRQKKEREKIRNYLWRILEITNADRVIYGEFHNGEIYISGSHKLKFSARVEVKEEGIASIYNTIQDIPGENFDSEIEEFNQKKYLVFLKDVKDKPLYQEFLEKYNLEQVLDILVTDHKDRVIGMISIQFLYITEKNNTENLDHEAMKKIFIYKNRIEFILNKKRNKFSILSLWENMG